MGSSFTHQSGARMISVHGPARAPGPCGIKLIHYLSRISQTFIANIVWFRAAGQRYLAKPRIYLTAEHEVPPEHNLDSSSPLTRDNRLCLRAWRYGKKVTTVAADAREIHVLISIIVPSNINGSTGNDLLGQGI